MFNIVHCNEHYYYVHETLLQSGAESLQAPLCTKCHVSLNSGRVPELSIANSKDYGRLDVLRELVGEMTSAEQQVTSGCLRCHEVVKYVGSVNNDGSVTSVKGHVIAFAHDGTEVLDSVIDTLPRRDLRGRLDVVFCWAETALDIVGDEWRVTSTIPRSELDSQHRCGARVQVPLLEEGD